MARRQSYATFYALLRRLPNADKEQLVSQWTNGRTCSLREMTDEEYSTMIHLMQERIENIDAKRKARSAVLKQLQLYGIDTTDWDAIDRFCRDPRIAGKRFSHLSIDELRILRTKMLSIRNKAERKDEANRRREIAEAQTKGQMPS
jgi:hypothetical protein